MTQPFDVNQLADRVAEVRYQIAEAAAQAGRAPQEIQLCAVCKGQDAQMIKASALLPVDLFGENRMQEMQLHLEANAFQGKPCHFIGHLQTNKVRRVVGAMDMIQSVNSLRLLNAIDREAERQGIVQDILFEINIGEEDSKTGASQELLWPMLDAAAALTHVRVRGLMAIPPAFDNSPQSRRYFAGMYRLLEQARQRYTEHAPLDTLSLGMTDSFLAAILEGATLVRVGRAIYGARA
ncbi:MAG: YggS family pyridoxal phosphate-dependent enzyme [Clostridiales bacterium]|nr:YggS family pyridoxal phosphate-dependent enzyme [Clostridiales bacterium]